MKPPFFLLAVLIAFNLPAQSQVLTIFEQSTEELKEYSEQIAALELLLTRQQKGYQIVESGLTTISTISGSEFTLHQDHYGSLATINPSIADAPNLMEISSLVTRSMLDLVTAESRWSQSQYLTSGDIAYASRTRSILTNTGNSQLATLLSLRTNDNLSMSEDQRIMLITQVHAECRSLYLQTQTLIDAIDCLIENRKKSDYSLNNHVRPFY